jgi:putative MATE family efflux protein
VTLSVVLNAVLDPLFIETFHLGINGAAIATVLSQGAAFIYGILYSIIKAGVPFSIPRIPSVQQMKTIGKLGIPAGLQMMTISAGTASITGVAAGFGQSVLAGFGASQRINNLIMIPIFTLGTAVTSMSGQNIGAKKWSRVSEITKQALTGIFIISLSIGLLVFIFSNQLIQLFVNDQETIKFGSSYLKSVAFFYVFLGINFVLNGVIRASGAMFQILILNLISFWLLRFPLSFFFSRWFGAIGIGYGMGLSFVISSLFAIGYYKWGHWREIELFRDKDEKKSGRSTSNGKGSRF